MKINFIGNSCVFPKSLFILVRVVQYMVYQYKPHMVNRQFRWRYSQQISVCIYTANNFRMSYGLSKQY